MSAPPQLHGANKTARMGSSSPKIQQSRAAVNDRDKMLLVWSALAVIRGVIEGGRDED